MLTRSPSAAGLVAPRSAWATWVNSCASSDRPATVPGTNVPAAKKISSPMVNASALSACAAWAATRSVWIRTPASETPSSRSISRRSSTGSNCPAPRCRNAASTVGTSASTTLPPTARRYAVAAWRSATRHSACPRGVGAMGKGRRCCATRLAIELSVLAATTTSCRKVGSSPNLFRISSRPRTRKSSMRGPGAVPLGSGAAALGRGASLPVGASPVVRDSSCKSRRIVRFTKVSRPGTPSPSSWASHGPTRSDISMPTRVRLPASRPRRLRRTAICDARLWNCRRASSSSRRPNQSVASAQLCLQISCSNAGDRR
jgi:hypothetical protein